MALFYTQLSNLKYSFFPLTFRQLLTPKYVFEQ